MPLSTALRKLLCCAPGEQEETEAPQRRPVQEPVAGRPVQPGRPYQDYVENETERYWQEMVKVGSLTKPDLQEIRAAARPVLGLAQRYRPGWKLNPALNRAQQAVAAMQLHAWEQGWIKPPYSRLQMSPNYVEALVQLADDAGWLAREIPLPDHPPPKHPPIYYTIDPATKRPVPGEDSLIRAEYVHTTRGTRLTKADYIHPWRGTGALPSLSDMTSQGWDTCYSLDKSGNTVEILLHWVIYTFNNPSMVMVFPLEALHFSPYPPIT